MSSARSPRAKKRWFYAENTDRRVRLRRRNEPGRRCSTRQAAGKIPSGEIVLVAASNPKAYALERAARAGVKSVVVERRACGSQEAFEDALRRALRESGRGDDHPRRLYEHPERGVHGEWPERILNVHRR